MKISLNFMTFSPSIFALNFHFIFNGKWLHFRSLFASFPRLFRYFLGIDFGMPFWDPIFPTGLQKIRKVTFLMENGAKKRVKIQPTINNKSIKNPSVFRDLSRTDFLVHLALSRVPKSDRIKSILDY